MRCWPKGFVYVGSSLSPEMNTAYLRLCLGTGVIEDQNKISPLIEEKKVHPHIQVERLASSHSLAKVKARRGHLQYGVFALQDIAKGEDLGEYVGELYLENADQPLEQIFARRTPSEYAWIAKMRDFFLLVEPARVANELAFINDYRNLKPQPNVHVKWIVHRGAFYLGYATVRPVKKGEELLVDYGENYWKALQRSKE